WGELRGPPPRQGWWASKLGPPYRREARGVRSRRDSDKVQPSPECRMENSGISHHPAGAREYTDGGEIEAASAAERVLAPSLFPAVPYLRTSRLPPADVSETETVWPGACPPPPPAASLPGVTAGRCKGATMRAKRLTLQQRQEIFHALVTTQDMGL